MSVLVYVDFTDVDEATLISVERLKHHLPKNVTLIACTDRPATSKILGVKIIELTEKEIFTSFRHSKNIKRGIVPGNPDLKMMAALRHLPEFDVLVRLEYDVYFTGDMKTSLLRLIELAQNYDLCASYISEITETNHDWMWWDDLAVPEYLFNDVRSTRLKAFLPVMTCSKKFLNVYSFALSSGWSGHYEVLVPSVAKYYGLQILDLSQGEAPLTTYPGFGAHEMAEISSAMSKIMHPVKSRQTIKLIANDC